MRQIPQGEEAAATVLRPVSAADARPLRSAVLRPGQPFERNIYPADDSGLDAHFGVFEGSRLVAVASMYLEPLPGQAEDGAWRLRGVSVLPDRQRRSYGQALMAACRQRALAQGGRLLWCYARQPAVPFYEKLGFQAIGQPIDVPNEGLHRRMALRLD